MYCHVGMRWGSWVSAGRKGRRRKGLKARGQGRARRKDFKVLFAQGVLTPNVADSFLLGFFRLVGGGSGGLGSGVSGRVSPPGTHVLLILGVERVHHIRRGLGIVAALLEALHRVRLGLLHGHLPSRLCTAVVDDGGAARVSPARVGAVRRGCARVAPLGRDAGLLLELRTVVDCFRSGRWGRAGVRSGRRVTCVGRKKNTRRVQHNTRPAKRPVRAGRGTTRPELGPGDDRRVIDVAQRPCPHRHRERRGVPVARARPPVAPCRSEKSRIWL